MLTSRVYSEHLVLSGIDPVMYSELDLEADLQLGMDLQQFAERDGRSSQPLSHSQDRRARLVMRAEAEVSKAV